MRDGTHGLAVGKRFFKTVGQNISVSKELLQKNFTKK